MQNMRFGKTAIATLVGAFLSAAAAQAADLPSRAPPPIIPPAPVFSWTGFYIGGYGGGHFSETTSTSLAGPSFFRTKKDGFVAGGIVGANYQINQFVLGVEGDGGYTDYDKSGGFTDDGGNAAVYHQKADYNAHVRGRVGYAVGSFGFGQTLLYAAGGGAFINHKLTLTELPFSDTGSRSRAGYTVGGGVEVAVTNNVILRGEYLYDDYGRSTYPYSTTGSTFFNNRSVQITDSTARAALEYKF